MHDSSLWSVLNAVKLPVDRGSVSVTERDVPLTNGEVPLTKGAVPVTERAVPATGKGCFFVKVSCSFDYGAVPVTGEQSRD